MKQMSLGIYNLAVTKLMIGFLSILGLVLVVFLVFGSVIVFTIIQSWLAAPNRKQFNDDWFRRFDEQMQERYEDKELRWRYFAMANHWANADKPVTESEPDVQSLS